MGVEVLGGIGGFIKEEDSPGQAWLMRIITLCCPPSQDAVRNPSPGNEHQETGVVYWGFSIFKTVS